jgi:WD40 repeat protein
MSFAAVLERIEKAQNPYPGPRPFETQESPLFFGRDQQIAELVTRLQRSRLVAVVGVSGGGKSSLVRAGLIPALERTHVGGAGARWRIVVTRPAGVPFQSLATDLQKEGLDSSDLRRSSQGLVQVARQLGADETLLVVVDQFEELFRYKDLQVVDKETRQQREAAASEAAEFVQLLLDATQYLPAVYIVLTMRSDYLGECAEFRGLPEALNECQYLVPRLTRQQRMEAIEGPLGQTEIAPSLVQRILNDAGDEPDRLPLLQHVLMRTWSQWRKSDPGRTRRIELQDYEHPAVGGLEHALDLHAEELLKEVPREIAETIFKRLTAEGRSRKERRNPAPLAELWEVCGAETEEERKKVNAVIDRFRQGEATFLTPRDGTLAPDQYIDITHESLIREWGTLRGWVAEEAESRAHFLRIHDDAQRYAQHKVDLWRDPELQLALDWWEKKKPNAAWARRYIGGSTTDNAGFRETWAFLEKSRQARQEEAARVRRRRLTIQIVAGVVMLAMAALILWGTISRARMKKEHQSATARALAFTSLVDQTEHPDQLESSTLYAIESVNREPTSASVHTLQTGVSLLRKRVPHLEQKGRVWGVAFSPDGRYLATTGPDQQATVYDSSGNRVRELGHTAEVWALAFNRDGKYMATGAADGLRVFDTSSWREVWHDPQQDPIDAVAFSPDGQLLAGAGLRNAALVFDLKTRKKPWDIQHSGPVRAVAFSPDGRYLATGGDDRMLRVSKVRSHEKPLWGKELKGAVRSVAFSPDSRYLAVGDYDGTARIFDVQGNEVAQWPHRGAVIAVAFSPDGRYLATGVDDGVAHVFEVADRSEVLQQPHKSAVLSLAFSPNGRLASSSVDGAVDVVEVKSPDEIARLHLPSKSRPNQAAITWDAKYMALADESGSAQVFEMVSGKSVSPPIHLDGASLVGSSTGGRYVALGGESGASVFDPSTGKALGREWRAAVFEASTGQRRFTSPRLVNVTSIDITPDGRYLATGGDDGLRVFDVSSGKLAWKNNTDFKYPISSVAFSMNGQTLAVGGEGPELLVFSTERGDPVARVPFHWSEDDCKESMQPCKANGIAFSMDGKYVVLSASDKKVRVMDVAQAREFRVADLPASAVYAMLSEDDKFLATSSSDLMGRVYEVETSTPREVWHMPLGQDAFFPLAFTSKDKYVVLATGSPEMVVERLLWRPQDLIERACASLDRNLTPEEWKEFSKGAPPKTCPPPPSGSGGPSH